VTDVQPLDLNLEHPFPHLAGDQLLAVLHARRSVGDRFRRATAFIGR
jgi:hypothetical protein